MRARLKILSTLCGSATHAPIRKPFCCRTRWVNQLASLERRTSRGGKETIDHSPGARERGGRRRALRGQSAYGQGDGAEALAALAIFPMHTVSLTFATLGVSVDRVSYKDTSAKQG